MSYSFGTRSPLVPLRRLVQCLDGRRIPLNSEDRKKIPGSIPYWGANGVVDHVGQHIFNENLVLLGEDGAPFFDPGKDVAFSVSGQVWVNNHIHVLRPTGVEQRYLTYALNCVEYSHHITGTTRDKLTQDDMNGIKIPLPSRGKQREISGFLDVETMRIGVLITKMERLKDLLTERFKASRRKVILSGVDPTGVDSYRGAKLGVVVRLQRGHDLPIDDRGRGDVPVISSGGFSGTHDSAAVTGPGVVTGRYGTIGEVFYVERDYWPLNTTLYVSDFRGCFPRWVYHVLAALPLDIDSAKSAVTGIDRNVVGGLRVPLPSVGDQQLAARELDRQEMDVKLIVEQIGAQLNLLAERRLALITAVVSGEMEVPGMARVGTRG